MPVMVQNEQAGPTVLSSDPKGTHYVEWQGKGDVNGHDIQPVPDEIFNSVPFQRSVSLGILTILDENLLAETIADSQGRQRAAWDKRNQGVAEEAQGVLDHQANNDLISVSCIGPSREPGKRCGADALPVKADKRDDTPPLCAQHVGLAPEYVSSHELVNGRNQVVWTRVTMGARQTYQP